MKGLSDYAVVYDIASDEERRRVDSILKAFGFRIQKSVFECRMSKKGRDALVSKLEGIRINTGFIKIYRLEYSWKNHTIGKVKKESPDAKNAFIV
jgi:CRISPR-associated protein Cas2